MELQCAKGAGYFMALSYLDTAYGIELIAVKLPYGLQERWMSDGSRFKEENDGQFPPFKFFAGFVRYEAFKRNDPSFALPNATNSPVRPESLSFKGAIKIQKKDIVSTGSNTNSRVKGISDPNRSWRNTWILRLHVLEGLDDRKTFLKERGICFKCCSLTTHMVEDCQTSVKCMECDSTKHTSRTCTSRWGPFNSTTQLWVGGRVWQYERCR